MLNSVNLAGRITRDIELKTTSSGKEFTNITLAVNRGFKNAQGIYEADFINCVAFGQTAKHIGQFGAKGKLAIVNVGRIGTRNYDDQNGKKVFITEVIIENIDLFIGNPKNEYNNNDNSPSNFVPNNTNNSPYNINNNDMAQEIEDNLPF